MAFTEGFLWGAATSAFQYEGAATEGGKGWSTADERCCLNASNQADASVAVDGYHHWEEDVALLKELGAKAYRFSISWARVIPTGDGEVNEEGVAFYNRLIDALVNVGIAPVVTLLHFDIPFALVEKYGAFADRRAIDAFERYARLCFERFGDRVKHWITVNEQNVMVRIPEMLGYTADDPDCAAKCAQANYHLYLASARAVACCKQMWPDALIGPDVSYPTIFAMTCSPDDVNTAFDLQQMMAFDPMRSYTSGHISLGELRAWKAAGITPTMLPGDEEILAAGAPNFMAVNWYCSTVVDTAAAEGEGGVLNIGAAFRARNPYLDYTEWGWSYDPRALRIALRECYERFHLPLMVCENGWSQREELGADGTVHDAKRIDYIREHVASMSQAIDEGVDLIGYTYWSFVDILSSSDGMGKRYGLVYVDREDFDEKECARHPKDSFWYYQKLIASNGADLEHVPRGK